MLPLRSRPLVPALLLFSLLWAGASLVTLSLPLASGAGHVSSDNSVDEQISILTSRVTSTTLTARIADLSGERAMTLSTGSHILTTRYTFASNQSRLTEQYLYEALVGLGYAPRYEGWNYGAHSGRTIIAEIRGSEEPDRIWLVGSHFDSNSEIPYESAPGADGSASGVAATLAIAAALQDQTFAQTVRFVFFGGEEQGQWGSRSYVDSLVQSVAQIEGFFNLDTIGYDGDGDGRIELHAGAGPASAGLAGHFAQAGLDFDQQLLFERITDGSATFSDQAPFWQAGYPALLISQNFFDGAVPHDRNPTYHTSLDRLANLDLPYLLAITRTTLASVARLAGLQVNVVTPTPTITPTPLRLCTELVENGDFEAENQSVWRFGSSPVPASIGSEMAHTGEQALRMGIAPTGTQRLSHSSAFQSITIPADLDGVELRFWEYAQGGGDGADLREVRLLNSNLSNRATLRSERGAGEARWIEHRIDLNEYQGESLILYFNVFNNGRDGRMLAYVDDVSVESCLDVKTTPTATATSTPDGAQIPRSYLPQIRGGVQSTPALTPTTTPTALSGDSRTSVP